MPHLEPTPEDRRQTLLDQPQPGDDDVIGLTRHQATKLAAILDAHTRTDHATSTDTPTDASAGADADLWTNAVLDGRDLLLAHAYNDRRPAPGIPHVTDAAARLDSWPWPPHPQPHPNLDRSPDDP